jgi:MFS family permease
MTQYPANPPQTPWWRELNREHWFVLTMASMAWALDCFDQQIFNLARNPAITALMPNADPTVIRAWGPYTTSIFVAGWATGGLIFGPIGDRIGRARTLMITVLMYSICTGLSAFAHSVVDFAIYRFITGLGVGGVFGLSVALIADSLPDRARPNALGVFQALSAVGNIGAGLLAIVIGYLEASQTLKPGSEWRYMFLVGALPALLCVVIQTRLKEPEKWRKARDEGRATGVKFGSYAGLFGDSRWRKAALLGMVLCVAGVVGLWGVGVFSPELVSDVITRQLRADNVPADQIAGKRMIWTGINMVMQQIGCFFGMMAFTRAAQRFGRKPSFIVAFIAAFVSTALVFKFLSETWHIFVFIPIMGFFQLALFAGFAIYLPELFPTRLRSTGVSFCYNVGRFVAASGPFTLGILQAKLAAGATTPEARLDAFRDASVWTSSILLVGLVAIAFLPETKGRPLPE